MTRDSFKQSKGRGQKLTDKSSAGREVLHLCHKDAKEVHAEAAELVVFDELVEVDAEHLKHKAEMFFVHEAVVQPHDVVLVLRVASRVKDAQDLDLHARLMVVCHLVLYYLHSHVLPRLLAPTLCHLPKRALS
jgi:hypothetical protein